MKASVSCPNCASSFSISRANAGKKAKCPKCEQPFVISFGDDPSVEDDLAAISPPLSSQLAVPPQLPAIHEVGSTKVVASNNKRSTAATAPGWLVIAAPALLTFFVGYGLGFLTPRTSEPNAVASRQTDSAEQPTVSPPPKASIADNSPATAPVMAAGGKTTPDSQVFSDRQLNAATDAVAALSKVEAAIEIGVNYQKYTSTLADVNAAVNEAERNLPGSPIAIELNAAMQAYKDVAELWSFKIRYSSIAKTISKEFHAEIIDRYAASLPKEEEIDTDLAMQLVWIVAGKRIETARSLLP